MDQIDRRNEILVDLYKAYFLSESNPNLKKLAEEQGWEKTPFWNLVERMKSEGLIENAAMGGFYRITALGVIDAEETGIAPEELVNTNQKARTKILLGLAKVYEEQGSLYTVQNSTLYSEAAVDPVQGTANLLVLRGLGYAEGSGNAGSKLTLPGLKAVEEYRKNRSVADEFETISTLSPQPRGRALQKLIAKVVNRHGWDQNEGVKTSNEEMDVIVFRDREYYLLESKWEKDPIEAPVIRELFGKLGNRIDVRGIIASMSGFTAGAVKQVHDYTGQRVILLYGSEDVKALVYGKATFDELLNAKYKALVTKRMVEFS
jgi:hypothetical protein